MFGAAWAKKTNNLLAMALVIDPITTCFVVLDTDLAQTAFGRFHVLMFTLAATGRLPISCERPTPLWKCWSLPLGLERNW